MVLYDFDSLHNPNRNHYRYLNRSLSFFFIMPNIWLSGFIFPIDSMPKIFQYLTYLIPLRYYLTIIRGIFMKGIGFAYLWEETLILFLIGVAVLGGSLLRFRRHLD